MLMIEWLGLSTWVLIAWFTYVAALAVWIILQKREPAATLAWIMSLAALPVIGFFIYYVFGPRRIERQRKRRQTTSDLWDQTVGENEAMAVADAPHELTVRHTELVQASCQMPLTTATSLELLVDGAATYDALCEAIAGAQEHVHVEYYIFAADRTGTRVRDALIERARAGVEVRVLLDAAGSWKTGDDFLNPLRDAGAEAENFHHMWGMSKFRPVFNFRSHRKICIVDAKICFTGGVNITDDENERLNPETYFHDVHLRMEGQVANHLQRVFLEDWHYATDKLPDPESYVRKHETGEFALQVIASGPDCRWEPTHRAFVDAIHAATDRVWLTTPYFVPSEAALMALTSAAMRGVDVRVLTPEKSDSKLAKLAARSFYDEILAAGVRVFEYQPRMLHAKALLIDDGFVVIGTSNFDSRSFRLNFEVDVVIHEQCMADSLEKVWKTNEAESIEIQKDRPQPPFLRRLREASARLLAPML